MAAEAIPVVGAVVAVLEAVKLVRDAAVGAVTGALEATASLATLKDGSARVHELGGAISSVSDKLFYVNPALGVLGSVAGAAVSGIASLDDAVKGTADRLAQYHGGLAEQQAMQGVNEMMRDISRAQRFGDSTQGANEARFDMEQKLADITDRFLPFVMKIGEGLFKIMTRTFTVVDDGFKANLQMMDGVLAAISSIPGVSSAMLAMGVDVTEMRRMIADSLTDNATATLDTQFNLFLAGNPAAPVGTFA